VPNRPRKLLCLMFPVGSSAAAAAAAASNRHRFESCNRCLPSTVWRLPFGHLHISTPAMQLSCIHLCLPLSSSASFFVACSFVLLASACFCLLLEDCHFSTMQMSGTSCHTDLVALLEQSAAVPVTFVAQPHVSCLAEISCGLTGCDLEGI